MIKVEGIHNLKFKCVFNLNEDNCYEVEDELGTMKINKDSLIVEIETATILAEKIISLELIAVGYEDIENTYRKFIMLENEICIRDGKIRKNVIDNMYYNNIVDKETLSTIILDAISILDNGHFC